MKKFLSFSCSFLISMAFAWSQCAPTVNSASEVLNGFSQRTNSGKYYWVCKGGDLNLTGSNNTVYAEDSADIVVAGDSNVIYQKQNGTLFVSGNFNEANYGSSTSFSDNGANTISTKCSFGISFEYNQAPANGCDVFAGIQSASFENSVSIYPVPASDHLTVEVEADAIGSIISIYAIDGKKHRDILVNGLVTKLDISRLRSGMYYLELKQINNRLIKKFVVE